MPEEHPLAPAENGLVIRPSTDLVRLPEGGSSALSEIISRSLVHIQASQSLGTLHRIGAHELYGPDYRLVCAWAEELGLTAEEVLIVLLRENIDIDFQTELVRGRFISLSVDRILLPLGEFHLIEPLVLETLKFDFDEAKHPDRRKSIPKLNRPFKVDLSSVPKLTKLACEDNRLSELDLSAVPNLTTLSCGNNQLSEFDLSRVPNLTELSCNDNQLTELDLSTVPNLDRLWCAGNQLSELDLSTVPDLTSLFCNENQLTELDLPTAPNLTYLWCNDNQLTELDLSTVPNLTYLWCGGNQLSELDLSAVPNLTELFCYDNQLTELDLSMVPDLRFFSYDKDSTKLIQLPTQNF